MNNRKIGLALSGGAALGSAHIGVLKALDENGISIHSISGTSVGALIAALYAFGKNWEEIAKIAKDLDWLDISDMTLSKFGLLSNHKIRDMLHEHIGEAQMENSHFPMAVIATDATSGERVLINRGPVDEAVMASTCIPGIFVPVEKDDQLLIDGGVVENVPCSPFIENKLECDFLIAVNLNAEYATKRPENLIQTLLNSFQFMMVSASKMQSDDADLIIAPDLSAFNGYETDQADGLIEKGYEACIESLKYLD